MDIPSPGMGGNPGPHFDQTLNQPVHGPLHFFAPDIELSDHVQEVVGQNPHFQPGLVGLKTLATGLVPAQSVFAFLNPVFHLAPALGGGSRTAPMISSPICPPTCALPYSDYSFLKKNRKPSI